MYDLTKDKLNPILVTISSL